MKFDDDDGDDGDDDGDKQVNNNNPFLTRRISDNDYTVEPLAQGKHRTACEISGAVATTTDRHGAEFFLTSL
jgi:hypothetical protein